MGPKMYSRKRRRRRRRHTRRLKTMGYRRESRRTGKTKMRALGQVDGERSANLTCRSRVLMRVLPRHAKSVSSRSLILVFVLLIEETTHCQKHVMDTGMDAVVLGRVVIITMRIRRSTRMHGRRRIRLQWVRASPSFVCRPADVPSLLPAFSQVQHDLADAPLLTTPPSDARGDSRESRAPFETPNFQQLDTPVRIARPDDGSRRTDVDIRVVDALLQETAVATDVARALAERVEVLERALQVRRDGEGRVERPIVHHSGSEDERGGGGKGDGASEDDKGNGDTDGLRLQLRLVEAERDKAQQIVRDVKAYLLDDRLA